MSDHVFTVQCVVAEWTAWEPRWVLLHRGVYEYREFPDGETKPYTFTTMREVVAWVRTNRPGWWVELPWGVLYG